MENTYLDAEAMSTRIGNMQSSAEEVYNVISSTNNIMEDLKGYFEGTSASNLQAKYEEVANTYTELKSYLDNQAELMQQLTENIKSADVE